MSAPFFRFKRFTVWHDQCAMKVNTDGVLLGTWCPLPSIQPSIKNVLDIGTGSGLIALIIAQRLCHLVPTTPKLSIDAIDINTQAIQQAAYNFAQSPFSPILTAHLSSIQDFTPSQSYNNYQLIISNPPYFQSSLKNPDTQRAEARHTDTLSYAELMAHSKRLLATDGLLALILPIEAQEEIISLGKNHHLYPTHITHVHSKPGKPAKRLLIAFTSLAYNDPIPKTPKPTSFYIESSTSTRSEEYQTLTQDFYL